MTAPNTAAVCGTCGQPLPAEPTTDAATPMPRFVVDVRDRVGGRRVFWDGFDPGDYAGDVTLPLSAVYAVTLPKVSVFGRRWGPGEYLERADLLELARTTVDRPPPVHPVSLAGKRAQRAADAPTAPAEGEVSTA